MLCTLSMIVILILVNFLYSRFPCIPLQITAIIISIVFIIFALWSLIKNISKKRTTDFNVYFYGTLLDLKKITRKHTPDRLMVLLSIKEFNRQRQRNIIKSKSIWSNWYTPYVYAGTEEIPLTKEDEKELKEFG